MGSKLPYSMIAFFYRVWLSWEWVRAVVMVDIFRNQTNFHVDLSK